MLIYQAQYMGKSFDFQYWNINTLKIVPQIHEFCEILYCVDGAATIYLDGQKRIVPQGHIAFIFPNHIHEYTIQTPYNAWCAVFSGDFLQPFFSLYPNRYPRDPVLDIREQASLIQQLLQTPPEQYIRLAGLLQLLFSVLLQKTELIEQGRPDTSPYMTALNYVARNYRTNISLASMAKELGYHEKYLSAVLHSLTKMHFRDFLATYRIEYVKKQLISSTDPISQIALDAGFSSINTFNKVFKKFTGMSPTDFRKLQQ